MLNHHCEYSFEWHANIDSSPKERTIFFFPDNLVAFDFSSYQVVIKWSSSWGSIEVCFMLIAMPCVLFFLEEMKNCASEG